MIDESYNLNFLHKILRFDFRGKYISVIAIKKFYCIYMNKYIYFILLDQNIHFKKDSKYISFTNTLFQIQGVLKSEGWSKIIVKFAHSFFLNMFSSWEKTNLFYCLLFYQLPKGFNVVNRDSRQRIMLKKKVVLFINEKWEINIGRNSNV